MILNRVLFGQLQVRAPCGRWYVNGKLPQHIHRYHRERCRCIAICNPPKPR